MYPRKLTYDEFIANVDSMPCRKDFINKQIHEYIEEQITQCKPLYFMPNAVSSNNAGPYELHVYGTFPDGSKVCVKIVDISIHVDITSTTINIEKLAEYIKSKAIKMRNEQHDKFSRLAVPPHTYVEQFPPNGFHIKPLKWLRYTPKTFYERFVFLRFIEQLRIDDLKDQKYGLITANDDPMLRGDQYYMVAAATYRFNTGDWNIINNYEIQTGNNAMLCDYTINVSVNDYTPMTDEHKKSADSLLSSALNEGAIMLVSWDIETHQDIDTGRAPLPGDDYTIFDMGSAYFWHHSAKPIFTSTVIIGDANIDEDVTMTIVCTNEKQLLEANYILWSRMRCDSIIAFNGGNFDWTMYREKLFNNDLGPEFIKAMRVTNYDDELNKYLTNNKPIKERKALYEKLVARSWSNRERIKIDATNDHNLEAVFTEPGIIDLDVLPIMLKAYPRAEVPKLASLNFFLSVNKLSSKEDMPYKLMFKIYERARELLTRKSIDCTFKIRPCIDCVSEDNIKYTEFIKPELLIDPNGPNSIVLPAGPRDILALAKLEIEPSPELLANLKPIDAFKEQSREHMRLVSKYCIIDCIRPQQLFVKRGVYAEHRAIANLSKTSVFDAFYRAGGMKVRNMIRIYSRDFNLAFSNARCLRDKKDKNHYPGAWVFKPQRGLHTDRPITGEDVASLYPSLKMTYNLSPDMVVKDPAVAKELMDAGYTLHQVGPFEYEQGEEKGKPSNKKCTTTGWVVRHNGAYGKNPHMRHEVKKNVTIIDGARKISYDMVETTPALPGERMGIFPYIVKMLFDMRVPVKKEFVEIQKIIEIMHSEELETYEFRGQTYTLSELQFRYMIVEAKQKAIKLLANTFYGESGNFLSPIYELIVAAGITIAGQATIKSADAFCRALGYTTTYGDTDSLYLKCPPEIYAEMDKIYEQEYIVGNAMDDPIAKYKYLLKAKLRYWTAMVKATMKKMSELTEQLSDHMLSFNNTNFINLAYEEVLFPTGLMGKKKYFGTPHVGKVNFGFTENDIDNIIDDLVRKNEFNEQSIAKIAAESKLELFVRGIESVKQGKAPVLVNIGETVMKRAVSIWNTSSLQEIVTDMIHTYYRTDIPVAKFVKLGRYKSDKKNVPMHTFYKRMQQAIIDGLDPALYTPSEEGDKFKYVVCKKPQLWTLSGNKIDMKIGHQMEYLRVYEASQDPTNNIEPLVIDKDYYMKNSIVGILARFISFQPEFQPPDDKFNIMDDEEYKNYDKYCVNAASKMLTDMVDTITNHDKQSTRKTGVDYRAIYKSARKHTNNELLRLYDIQCAYICSTFDCNDNVSKILDGLIDDIKPSPVIFDKITAKIVVAYKEMHERYKKQLDSNKKKLRDEVYDTYNYAKPILERYNEALVRFVEQYRTSGRNSDINDIEFAFNLDNVDINTLHDLYKKIHAYIDLHEKYNRSLVTVRYLDDYRKSM